MSVSDVVDSEDGAVEVVVVEVDVVAVGVVVVSPVVVVAVAVHAQSGQVDAMGWVRVGRAGGQPGGEAISERDFRLGLGGYVVSFLSGTT